LKQCAGIVTPTRPFRPGSPAGPEYRLSVHTRFMPPPQRPNHPDAALDFFANPQQVQSENRVLATLSG